MKAFNSLIKGKTMKTSRKNLSQKLFSTLILTSLLHTSSYALSLNDAINEIHGGINNVKDSLTSLKTLDKQFDGLFSESLSLAKACFDVGNINLNELDICSVARELDNLKINTCSIFGSNKNKNIYPISGAQSFCNAKTSAFNNYISKTLNDTIEYSSLDAQNLDFNAKLQNGQTLKEYFNAWDMDNILKNDSPSNVVANYVKDSNTKATLIFMDYAKTSNKDISQLKIEDVSAPATLEDYKKGVFENVNINKRFLDSTDINNISSLTKAKMQTMSDKSKAASEVIQGYKKEFDLAKNNEIAYTLANSDYQKIAIPTQEFVSKLRKDLQPEAIYQIRKQQAYESAVINQITEKWQRKYALAQLIADKEAILAQSFDEENAKAQIESLIADTK